MALIGRLFVIAFGFLAACLVAGMIVVAAVLFPEFSDIGTGPLDQSVFQVLIAFGFIFISGFALLPAVIIALVTEAFSIRSVLAYAIGGALVGAACYLSLVPFDTETLAFRRHRTAAHGNHDRRGHRRWPHVLGDCGPHGGLLARAAEPAAASAALGLAPAAVVGCVMTAGVLMPRPLG